MKALQRESQALGANSEKSVVSLKYFSLIKTKELLEFVELSEAAADRCDWYVFTGLLKRGKQLLIERERKNVGRWGLYWKPSGINPVVLHIVFDVFAGLTEKIYYINQYFCFAFQ